MWGYADIRTVKALEESVKRMCELLEATPQNVVCDMHPKYNTVAFAEGLDLPLKKSSTIMPIYFPAWQKMTIVKRS